MIPTSPLGAPWEVLLVVALLLATPLAVLAPRWPREAGGAGTMRHAGGAWLWVLGLLVVQSIALLTDHPVLAFTVVAMGTIGHAVMAWPSSRTGAVMLLLASALTAATAAALMAQATTLALACSCLAIALRMGVAPLHPGVAALCARAPVVQIQQLASLIVLVFLHLRFLDHLPMAQTIAPWLVRGGALVTILAAVMSLVGRDLASFYRGATTMHAGMALAAIGTASIGNFGAALLVTVTMALALGGLGLMVLALETRAGPVTFQHPGGRVGAFPTLALLFALFGGAGVGLPGMAGFVADDLLLHTLWMESPASTVTVILASACLAVATLTAFSATFLGPRITSRAPDLTIPERLAASTLLIVLLLLGVVPGVLLTPADEFLTPAPPGMTVMAPIGPDGDGMSGRAQLTAHTATPMMPVMPATFIVADTDRSAGSCVRHQPGTLWNYTGTIGTTRVRLTLVFRGDSVAGVYSRGDDLQDRTLRGTLSAGHLLRLEERTGTGAGTGTGTPTGRFDADFPERDPGPTYGDSPLTCDVIAGRHQPLDRSGQPIGAPATVYLTTEGSTSGSLAHRYGAIGVRDDAVVHRGAATFWRAVQRNDRPTVAAQLRYPITILVQGRPRRFQTATAFLAAYDAVMTAAFRETILSAIPRHMFVRDQGVMLGSGAVWFGRTGQVIALSP